MLVKKSTFIRQMKASQADIPSELSLPIPLSATYQNLVLNIIEFDVFIKDKFLVYVIRLPLTNHVNYRAHTPLGLQEILPSHPTDTTEGNKNICAQNLRFVKH
jgi:hypothetical protein